MSVATREGEGGGLVYFMGPSGAGKDSLLAWLRRHLPAEAPVHWARRTISRPPDPQGENHEDVSADVHAAVQAADGFALHWQANGLAYGVRRRELDALAPGRWLFVNGSRAYFPQALQRYPGLVAVHITASAAVLRERLLARGRETPAEVEARVQRALQFQTPAGVAGIEVRNNTRIDDAGQQLLLGLRRLPGWPG